MDMIEHRVRERAYYIWEAEGRIAGRAESHWTQAEVELAASSVEAAEPAKAPRAKAAAKAPKAAAAKTPAKSKKAPRSPEAGIALH